MGRLELRRLLDRRLLQHKHLDDFQFHGCRRPVLVAVMALRLDRLQHRRVLRLPHGKNWCDISYWLSCSQPFLLWYLGFSLAGVQQGCYGLYLVRRSILYRREVCLSDDPVHLEKLGKSLSSTHFHKQYLNADTVWKDRNTIPNTFPEDSGTTTADWVSFFLFWLISLPAIWFPVHKIRHLFTVKAYFVPCAGIAFLIWAIVRAGGIGPIVHQPATISGSKLAWEFVTGVMSAIANFATLIVNDPDFSRFATKPKDALWSQLFTIPLGFAVTSFIGIFVSSSSAVIYNSDPVWDPLQLLEHFIDDGGSGQRFGVFVIATAFALAQLGTNIAANSVSAGTDLTALFPRFLNIRRGGYICAAVGLAMCPYTLLTDSNKFTTYLSAYSVFLSSIAGVMCSDYYIVRKGYLEIKELYDARKAGPYYFTYGVHWRAYVAYM